MEKQKKSIHKWQVAVQWICCAIWTMQITLDFLNSNSGVVTLLHCSAALCFFIAALLSTKHYRKEHQEEQP